MPVITISLVPQDVECKRCLVEDVTRAASQATNIPEDHFIVIIREHPAENWGVGGQCLTDTEAYRKYLEATGKAP